ncbi:hypothetical protein Tco_1477991 [Tanacetum coccineum]
MGCLPRSALFLVTESHSLTPSPHLVVLRESLSGRANFHLTFKCHRLKRRKMKSGDAGVKNDILTPGGEKKVLRISKKEFILKAL